MSAVARRQRSVGRLVALGALMCVVLAVCASSAGAATADTAYNALGVDSPDQQANEIFGQRIESANLGDGVTDVFASSYLANFFSHTLNATAAGQVTLFNGKDRSIRYELFSPEPQDNAQFGFYIQNLGDVNRDGKDDLAVGAPSENVDAAGNACTAGAAGCNANSGKVFVFEGSSGQLLYAINSPDPQSHIPPPGTSFRGFGSRIGSAGDVNGDGIADIIVGASSYDVPANCSTVSPLPATCHTGEGEAWIFSGKDGSLIRPLKLPSSDEPAAPCSSSCGSFGGTVQGPGDVNGDGVPDQFVSAYSLKTGTPTPDHDGRVYIFSGKDGSLLTRIDAPVPGAKQFFGLQDVGRNTPGDVNGDGAADIYVDSFAQAGPGGAGEGRAWVFDGKASVAAGHGVLLYEVQDPAPAAAKAFGFTADTTDYNKDGTPDLFVGGLGGGDHEVYVSNGKDGSPLKTLALPASEIQPTVGKNSGTELGAGLRALGDVNGDGEPDYVTGAAYQDVGGRQDQGKLYFFLSNVPPVPVVQPGVVQPVLPPGVLPPTTRRPPVLPRANLPGLRLSARRLVRGHRTIFIVRGSLRPPPSIVGSQRSRVCHGSVTVAARRGNKTGATKTVGLRKDCSFSLRIVVSTRKLGRKGRYNIRARFHGNANINARSQTTNIH